MKKIFAPLKHMTADQLLRIDPKTMPPYSGPDHGCLFVQAFDWKGTGHAFDMEPFGTRATEARIACSEDDATSKLLGIWAFEKLPTDAYREVIALTDAWDQGTIGPAELQEAIDECLEALTVTIPERVEVTV